MNESVLCKLETPPAFFDGQRVNLRIFFMNSISWVNFSIRPYMRKAWTKSAKKSQRDLRLSLYSGWCSGSVCEIRGEMAGRARNKPDDLTER